MNPLRSTSLSSSISSGEIKAGVSRLMVMPGGRLNFSRIRRIVSGFRVRHTTVRRMEVPQDNGACVIMPSFPPPSRRSVPSYPLPCRISVSPVRQSARQTSRAGVSHPGLRMPTSVPIRRGIRRRKYLVWGGLLRKCSPCARCNFVQKPRYSVPDCIPGASP